MEELSTISQEQFELISNDVAEIKSILTLFLILAILAVAWFLFKTGCRFIDRFFEN